MALPVFQRPYVWNREQVRSLMASLYRGHPVGSLLVWRTQTDNSKIKGNDPAPFATIDLLLDGQQRITTLYGIFKGKPPRFFEGNERAFTNLYFNLEDETFEFYAPVKMKDNPLWVGVTDCLNKGIGPFIAKLSPLPKHEVYFERLARLQQIGNVPLHADTVAGEDKTVDVVVDIFNRVNSGGTKLSKGDLALARICAQWPDARDEMKKLLARWSNAGFAFEMDWLLRNVNTIVTGEALFTALKDVSTTDFADGLKRAGDTIDSLLNLIAGRLGVDHDRVLGGRYAFPVMSRFLHLCGGMLKDHRHQDKLLFWYLHTVLWGRYAGNVETTMNQDLHVIESSDEPLDALIGQLRKNRGDLRLDSEDFTGSSIGARFYPLLYVLTRTLRAKDWGSGLPLTMAALGRAGILHVHHIFPKAQLYGAGYTKPDVNAVANFCFQTLPTNLEISDRIPEEYFPMIQRNHPGALESHWIPQEPALWKLENYHQFLAARRELLATAANGFLDSLLAGSVSVYPDAQLASLPEAAAAIPGGAGSEEEEAVLAQLHYWVAKQGLPYGQLAIEIADPATGQPVAVLDLAWPDGLQPGLSEPVALLIDEPREIEEAANRAGYRYFTDVEGFKDYVQREILSAVPEEIAV